MDDNINKEQPEQVPLFKKWSQWYILVIGFLLALVIFFYFFTKYFS